MSDPLFDSVDALLAAVNAGTVLPAPAERVRLREAAGLTAAAVAQALKTRPATVGSWEAGRSEPAGDKREAYRRLLEGLAARYPAPDSAAPTDAGATPVAATEPAPLAAAAPTPAAEPAPARPAARQAVPHRASTGPRTAPSPAEADGAADRRFANGPLLVLDGDGQAYGIGGLVLPCPARTIPDLVDWTLTHAQVGAFRLHRSGKESDPLVVLTAAAAEKLGLPLELEDRCGLRLPDNHPVNSTPMSPPGTRCCVSRTF